MPHITSYPYTHTTMSYVPNIGTSAAKYYMWYHMRMSELVSSMTGQSTNIHNLNKFLHIINIYVFQVCLCSSILIYLNHTNDTEELMQSLFIQYQRSPSFWKLFAYILGWITPICREIFTFGILYNSNYILNWF